MAVRLRNRGPLPVWPPPPRRWNCRQAPTLTFVLLLLCRVARRMPRRRSHHWLLVLRLVGKLKIALVPRSVVIRIIVCRDILWLVGIAAHPAQMVGVTDARFASLWQLSRQDPARRGRRREILLSLVFFAKTTRSTVARGRWEARGRRLRPAARPEVDPHGPAAATWKQLGHSHRSALRGSRLRPFFRS